MSALVRPTPGLRSLGLRVLGAAALLAIAGQAAAQGQVYDPLPPPGSAYVRFVNASGDEVTVRPDFLPGQTLGTVAAQRVTAYAVVQNVQGKTLALQVQSNAQSGQLSFTAEPGSFNTMLVEAAGAQALRAVQVVDQTDFNQSRARLSFYNATDCAGATLAIAPDGPVVFQDVAPGTAKARSVNPVSVAVSAGCAQGGRAPLDLAGLEAGGMYSIWLMPDGGGVRTLLTRDATAKWKP